MNQTAESLARFRVLAEAYGSDVERWPENERARARELVLRSPEARALLSSEQALDAMLAAADIPALPPALAAKLEQLPATLAPVRPLRVPRRAWRLPAVGWAAAALVGLWLGVESARTDEVGANDVDGVATAPLDSMGRPASEPASEDEALSEELADNSVFELASGSFDDWEDFR